jgi:hypothetical protein
MFQLLDHHLYLKNGGCSTSRQVEHHHMPDNRHLEFDERHIPIRFPAIALQAAAELITYTESYAPDTTIGI